MSRPIPETVAPLPLPEGFSDLPPAGKVDAIKELRTDPGTDLYTLQAIAWDALDGTLHDDRKPKRELLSEAGLALLAITDRKDELPANEQALYWDTQLALSTYTAFQARREKQLLGTIARRGIARHAGSIIQEIAEPANFHIADLPYVAAQKAIEAMMISMSALRQRWPFPTVVPSAPPLHRLSHIDRGTNTSAHSLYLLRREESKSEVDLTIPLSVDKIVDVSTYDPKRRRGVLQVGMEALLWNTSNGIQGIVHERHTKGDFHEAQHWLLDKTARHLAEFGVTNTVLPEDYAALIDLAARYVGKRSDIYDPNGLNAPVRR